MQTHTLRMTTVLLASLAAARCGQPASAEPRVFFVQPQDDAAVKSPVRLEFGVENFQVAAVPQAEVKETRPNLGHHHVAVDADCLPPGSVIPRAAPWVHFGDGKNVIDMQLPAGQHRLTLQIGDDLHRTIDGLCSRVTVNVTE
ncbi:MAG: hypothetical protein A3I61_02015 [Acidobacteria bacterium RIFCSPLOWO2_02_FULL_68_18]|nr:MAG: hypothetical protein A3I61_02015 [Acidobacteria bacterium RIFCSPLOWO2_02_FULL_68_18]OFW50252.1 MAG: hypothetical protein A3G77_09795 [Acidobacteria bacterium RIFCSPLOWO2_12_FULL_68_19]